MDVPTLAREAAAALVPALTFLINKASEGVATEAGKQVGTAAISRARSVWGSLQPHLEADPVTLKLVKDIAANPDQPEAVATLAFILRTAIGERPELADRLQAVLGEGRAIKQVTASGSRSIAIGGNADRSIFVTGDTERVND